MRTTIDKAGRLVLPKAARDQLGLKPGDVLEIQPAGDGLHLAPVHDTPRLEKDGHVLVFTGDVAPEADDAAAAQRQSRIDELVRQAIR